MRTRGVDGARARLDPGRRALGRSCAARVRGRRVLPGLTLDEDAVWAGLAELVAETAPQIAQALETRAIAAKTQIDSWHRERAGQPHDPRGVPSLPGVDRLHRAGRWRLQRSTPTRVDVEIAEIAGPQLVVPVSNARYALNAANARWGSLYDAVYGTDVLGSPPPPGPYDAARGARGRRLGARIPRRHLPARRAAPTATRAPTGSPPTAGSRFISQTARRHALATPDALTGYTGEPASPQSVLLSHHGLGVILEIDRDHPIGQADAAGIKDVVLESAVTTIVDFEDSVAAVDAADKVAAYANWLGLMRGDLERLGRQGRPQLRAAAGAKPHASRAPAAASSTCRGRALHAGSQRRASDDDRRGARRATARRSPRRCSTRC